MKRPIWKVLPGEEAPDFDLPSTGDAAGKGAAPGRVRLSQYRGTRNVVLAFFPAAFTPTWTVQLPSYEEDLSEFERRNAQVLGISTDQVPTAEAWAKSLGGLSYPLLSDHWPHGHTAALYGVLRGDGRAERAVFVVDRAGKVAYAHVQEIGSPPPLAPILAALDRIAWAGGRRAPARAGEGPLILSRLCVPFTPFRGRLEETHVCLVSTAGLRPTGDAPFEELDLGYRTIPAGTPAAGLALDHPRFDRTAADRDRNCLFPIDRLRELAGEGCIGGLTDRHFSTAYTPAFRAFAATTAAAVARQVAGERPGAVLLTAGCRACHRTAAALHRAIEASGIPAVVITAEPEETEQARVSRALAPLEATPGQPVGPPGEIAGQRRVVLAALGLLRSAPLPGEVVRLRG